MATSKRLRKGGNARWVILNAQVNDSFVVPRGFRIRYLASELQGAQSAANMTVGSSQNTFTTANFTVNSVASATTGTLTLAGGASASVTLAAGDITSTAGVAAKIAATAVSGWTLSAVGSTVYFTSVLPATAAPTIALGTATNITFSSVTSAVGTLYSDVVTAAAMGTAKGNIAAFTVASGKDYIPTTASADATYYLSFSTVQAAAGNANVYVQLEKFN